jgi:hypothetical protein
MDYSINLNNFKAVAVVATVLTTISCLVPEYAQALSLRFSGSPNSSASSLDFTLDTSVPGDSSGLFQGAIQEATYTCIESSIALCAGNTEIFFLPGDLQASQITDPSFGDLTNYPGESFIGGVQYEATLSDIDNNFLKFAFFVLPTDSNLINDLSNLSNLSTFSELPTQITENVNTMNFVPTRFTITPQVIVPEPNATSSLLSLGSLGAVLLLKGVKRSRKLQISQNSAVETQQVV